MYLESEAWFHSSCPAEDFGREEFSLIVGLGSSGTSISTVVLLSQYLYTP